MRFGSTIRKVLVSLACMVLILSFFATTVAADSNVGITRLGGSDRFETSAAVSGKGWTSADCVVLASSTAYADALAGVPFAYALDAPIMLVAKDAVSDVVAAEITRLGATKIYILGGSSVIGDTVARRFSDDGFEVERIFGQNRYETATMIAAKMASIDAVKSATVFLACGGNYPDALAIGSIAALSGSPILYSSGSGTLDEHTVTCIRQLNMSKVVILGGSSAIGDDVAASVRALGVTVSRCGGTDRYDTALNICQRYDAMFAGDCMCFATGRNYPDALAGGVLAAKKRSPVILIDENSAINGIAAYLVSTDPDAMYVFGGEGVLSDSLLKRLKRRAFNTTGTSVATTISTTPTSAATEAATEAATTATTATTTTTTTAATTTTTTTTATAAATTTTTAASAHDGDETYYIRFDTIVYCANGNASVFHRTPECSSMKSPIALTYAQALDLGTRPCHNCCANCVYDSMANVK